MMRNIKGTSGATGSMGEVKRVGEVGSKAFGGTTGGLKMHQEDAQMGTNKGPMDVGRGHMNGGERSFEHGMKGDKYHDQHIKAEGDRGMTHMGAAMKHLKMMHSERE